MAPHYTYRCEYVKCGKRGCKSCPHGPYWYGYYHEGQKLHKKYFGKTDPRAYNFGDDPAKPEPILDPPHPWDAILNRKTATISLARKILGMDKAVMGEKGRKIYLALVKKHHPDMGGDHKMMCWIGAAWSYYKYFYGVE